MGGGGALRKGLLDVTNLQQKLKLSNPDSKTQLIPVDSKDYIDKLHKENLSLKKQVADRNKIIELSGAELQRFRVNLQMTHQQNWQLAQANSQMLAELNSCKDRLKALQHELGCLKCMLPIKNLGLQQLPWGEEKTRDHQQTFNKEQAIELEEAGGSSDAGNKESMHSNTNRRRLSRASTTSAAKDAAAKEKPETKRLCKGRQSSRFKSEEPESSEGLFEIDEAKFPAGSKLDDTKLEGSSNMSVLENNDKDMKDGEKAITGSLPSEMRGRSSLGRPMRRATEKIQTYKEVPLNVKMRRTG